MFDYFKASRFCLFIIPVGVAIVTISTLFPFIVGKYVWLRTLVDLALIFFLLGLLLQDRSSAMLQRFKTMFREPLVIAVSVFIGVFLIACFLGVNPHFSFWSNFERGEGGLQLLHFWLFFVLLLTLFQNERDWRRLFGWAIVGGALSAAYGLMAGWNVENFVGPRFGDEGYRFQASIGNPSYVAAYALFLFSYTVYLLRGAVSRAKLVSGGSVFLFLIALGFLVMFFAAATRGAFVGFIAAAVAFAGYFIFVHKRWRKWLISGVAAILLLVVLLVYFKDTPFVKSLPGSRIFDISFSATTFEHRAIMWKIAWDGFKERPLLGWGPENFLTVFARHFNTAYFTPESGFGAWFDRAHSIYFDYLVETGILGLLSYLGMFGALFWGIFRAGRRNAAIIPAGGHPAQKQEHASGLSPFVGALLFAVPVAYLVQGLVLFDVSVTYLNVFMFLAFAAFKLRDVGARQKVNN